MTYDAVPQDLRDYDQWVCWRRQGRDGKPTKVPYRASAPRYRASATAPATWSSFDVAVSAAARDGSLGIGFVFTANDPFAGVDVDKAADDNGELHPATLTVVQTLDGYTEWSPSGTGLHIIVRGTLPGRGRKTAKVEWGGAFEIYDRGRFFTITGKALSWPAE